MTGTPNKTNIRAWVEALRSGNYEQTGNVLAIADPEGKPRAHCCLGVACEVAGIPPVVGLAGIEYDGYDRTLPPSAQVWLGIGDSNPDVAPGLVEKFVPGQGDGHAVSLACLNDAGATFAQIADLIEAKYLA